MVFYNNNNSNACTEHCSLDLGYIFFTVIDNISLLSPIFRFKYAYAIRTSGTTGNRRVVLVPHQAISINVAEFIKKFRMTKNDVVLGIGKYLTTT